MHIFELILERDLWMHDGIPFGQVGAVSTSGRETVVTFAAGCRLQITFDDAAAGPRTGQRRNVDTVCSSRPQGSG